MKRALVLILVWIHLLAVGAPSAAPGLPHSALFGSDYVGIEDWARANRFQISRLTRNQELKLVRGGTALLLAVDSRRISYNGINVWLAEPVSLHNGSAQIATVDIATVLNALLYPTKNPASRRIKTISLDPGHGGKDPGNQINRQQEKNYNLLLARELRTQLLKAGFKVTLTRENDSFIELPTRPELAKRSGADLFLSLHFNAVRGAGGAAVAGAEVYCMTPAKTSSTNARGEGSSSGSYPGNRSDPKNLLLGYHVQRSLVSRLGMEDRGVRRARFAVLRTAEMPAILIEGGFMTNPIESKKIYNPAYRRQLAQAIVNGVVSYKRIME